jgi:hypothetical protein
MSCFRPWLAITAITLLAAALTLAGRPIMPWKMVFPDYIHHWTAGKLIKSGVSPYDERAQLEIHQDLGWDRATDGRGILSFLPYYYPPWFAMACTLLLPLGYDGGKTVWAFVNLELLFLTGYLLRNAVPGLPRAIPLVAVPLFYFSVIAFFVGQTPILILFAAAVALKLVDAGWDRAGGVALGCLTTKPQLAAIVILSVAIWSVRQRQRRAGILVGFVLTLALVCLASTAVVPNWPVEMIRATRNTPPPTETFPWLGNTWFLILRTLGLQSWALWAAYLAVGIPFLAATLKSAGIPGRPFRDVVALGFLAVFFVAPYARNYDFVVLLIPAFVLIGNRLPEKPGALLMLALMLVPYLQLILLVRYSRLIVPGVEFYVECTYFWVPLLLAVLWVSTEPRAAGAFS